MNNIILFGSLARVSGQDRANGFGRNAARNAGTILRLHPARRPAPVATWRLDAAGRLECRWSSHPSGSGDEAKRGDSRNGRAA